MSAGFGLWRIWSALFLKRNHVILIMQLFRFECSIWKDRISTKSLRDINILTLKVKQSSFRNGMYLNQAEISLNTTAALQLTDTKRYFRWIQYRYDSRC